MPVDRHDVPLALANAAARSPWTWKEASVRMAAAVGESPRRAWIRSLARKLVWSFPAPPTVPDLARMIAIDPRLRIGTRAGPLSLPVRPSSGAPPLESAAAIAALLEVSPDALSWLADPRGMNPRARDPRLHHYTPFWVKKRSGGVRLLEIPKPVLRGAQRLLLDRVLACLPLHPAAMGFRRGRSVLDHARAHAGKRVVVRLDIEDFFVNIGFARVRGVLRAAGMAAHIADLLAGLATTSTPYAHLRSAPGPSVESQRLRRKLAFTHLPQGAPSSPALANLIARGIDRRLAGLAARFGATYTRYADDLAFSGDAELERQVPRLIPRASAVLIEEGFTPNHRKTRVMRAGTRQWLTGLVVNVHPSPSRAAIERLEATLFNCGKHGPATQNRAGVPDLRACLQGQIAWVEHVHPARGRELRVLFDRITFGCS